MGRTCMLSKSVFEQYEYTKKEVEVTRKQIADLEDSIEKLIEEGTVKDRVYGGEGGIQGFNIEGFPVAAYYKKLRKLRKKRMELIEKEDRLFDTVTSVEEEIDTLPNARDRLMMRKVYLEGMTQEEVARQLHVDRSLISKRISKII